MHSEYMMINIDFLSYFIEYAKTESLTKASKALHISQSALTRAMQKVEETIGVPIFEHTKNKLSLNHIGHELVKSAQDVLDSIDKMKEKATALYNKSTNISIGSVALGPLIKYGNLFYSLFPGKTIVSKLEQEDALIEKLNQDIYDFIFLSHKIEDENLTYKFAFKEELYISIPKSHFLASIKTGVHFSEIDGQSFLVSNNLGMWAKIVADNLPNSKIFPQSMENLNEIINSSTIPNFSTNITLSSYEKLGRVNIPILDDDAKVEFYLVYKKSHQNKLLPLLKNL